MSLHKIAVISDTHGLLRPEVIQGLKDDRRSVMAKFQELMHRV